MSRAAEIDIEAMFADARADDGARTVRVGLVGKGVQKSRTPAMHEAAGRAHGLNYRYRLLDTAAMDPAPPLREIIAVADAHGYAGLNVTYPYKVEIVALLDELSDAAESIGAVNTLVLRNGRRSGHNTDMWGFAESFRRNMAEVSRDTVVLLGAGGAGAAVAHALADCNAGTTLIIDADRDKAEALARAVSARHGAARAEAVGDAAEAVARADGLVNATPVGMAALPGMPVPVDLLRRDMWVADIVYFPIETELLRAARALGCRTLSGAGMAIFQAVRAFELFTGLKPDVERMTAVFKSFDETAPTS